MDIQGKILAGTDRLHSRPARTTGDGEMIVFRFRHQALRLGGAAAIADLGGGAQKVVPGGIKQLPKESFAFGRIDLRARPPHKR